MGNTCCGEKEEFKRVFTLNYCGISYSPFQFYFKEHQGALQKISQIFKELVKHYVKDFKEDKFKWDMGKIEKNFKLGRYSNMFKKQVGIEKKKFINKKEFDELWDISYLNYLDETSTKAQPQKNQDQVRLYDFIMYHTLLQFVYGKQQFENLIKNNPSQFQKTLDPFYKISFLNEKLKLQKFKAGIQLHMPDVIFIQEYSNVLLEYLKKSNIYHITIDNENDSLVALSKNFFKIDQNESSIVSSLQSKHKWFKTSAVTVANKIIFCSVHLTSNEEKNKDQVKQLKEAIKVLIDEYKTTNYNFVVAGDINSFIKLQQNGVYFYPQNDQQFTTLKKRTFSQAQYHKAEIKIQESKDKIISSFYLDKCKITFIDDQPATDQSYLPTDTHPHDHFLVQAVVLLKKE